jgi:phosphatidylserine decarboxylase
MGRLSDLRLPRKAIAELVRAYCAAYRIRLHDAVIPPGGFDTFNQFFTRRLKPGMRVIDPDPAVIASPSDGHVQAVGTVERGSLLQAKGRKYRLSDLLGGDEGVDRFDGGPCITIYLSPRDYHRVHFPCDGEVTGFAYVPGRLYTVAPRATELVECLFPRNERVTTRLEGPMGAMALVMVGATGVGRITMSYCDVASNVGQRGGRGRFDPGLPCRKGEDLGVFNLGSTVVMVLEPGRWETLAPPVGSEVRMGQGLFRKL